MNATNNELTRTAFITLRTIGTGYQGRESQDQRRNSGQGLYHQE